MTRAICCRLVITLHTVVACTGVAFCGSTITLDYPGGNNTLATGIDGDNVVGFNYSSDNGFLYNLSASTFTSLPAAPLAMGATNGTNPYDISGHNVVGTYHESSGRMHGFLCDLSTSSYKILDVPWVGEYGYSMTSALGISGGNIVGLYYDAANVCHGFLYNGSTFATLDDPNAAQNQFIDGTAPQGISGDNVVGLYYDKAGSHGFLYNISTNQYKTLDYPLIVGDTYATCIDGNTVCGAYYSSGYKYFLYDIPTAMYTTLNIDAPGPIEQIGGISGNTVVGGYTDTVSHTRLGFVATIPEPSTLTLLGMSAFGILALAWRRIRKAV